MRKIIVILLISLLGLNFFIFSSWADDKPPVKEEDRQTVVNNVTDFFATLGQDKQTATETVKERKQDRREARLREKERAQKRAMKQQLKDQQAIIMEKINAENAARYSK